MKHIVTFLFISCRVSSQLEAFSYPPPSLSLHCFITKLSPRWKFSVVQARNDAIANIYNDQRDDDEESFSKDIAISKNSSYRRRQPSERLQSSLTNLFSLSQRRSEDGDSSSRYETENSFELDVSFMEPSTVEDAPLLNEDIYINSERYMNADGSIVVGDVIDVEAPRQLDNLLSSLMNEAPEIPSDVYMQSKELVLHKEKNVDDEALLLYLSDNQNSTMQSTVDSEELHRLVFSNEKGFTEQSEAFRESLSSNSDQERKKEAENLRRGMEYRQRQEAAMANILREMDELEKTALSKEDAMKLSTLKNSDSSIILCSKCSCRLSEEEITREKKRGRTQANQMICRLCQVEQMQIKNGSPYLMGRVDRNGKPFPGMGLPTIQEDEKIQRIRRIGPMTEDYAMDDTLSNKRKTNEADSNAWREQFTNAMLRQQRGIPTANNRSITYASNSTSNSTTLLLNKEDVLTSNHTATQRNRYSNRPMELANIKHTFTDVSIWEAQYRAAMHRRQISQPYTLPTKIIPPQPIVTKQSSPDGTTTDSTDLQTIDTSSNENVHEIKTLLGRIRDLENTVSKYREQLDRSSKQIKGLQSMLDAMKNRQTTVKTQNASPATFPRSNEKRASVQRKRPTDDTF